MKKVLIMLLMIMLFSCKSNLEEAIEYPIYICDANKLSSTINLLEKVYNTIESDEILEDEYSLYNGIFSGFIGGNLAYNAVEDAYLLEIGEESVKKRELFKNIVFHFQDRNYLVEQHEIFQFGTTLKHEVKTNIYTDVVFESELFERQDTKSNNQLIVALLETFFDDLMTYLNDLGFVFSEKWDKHSNIYCLSIEKPDEDVICNLRSSSFSDNQIQKLREIELTLKGESANELYYDYSRFKETFEEEIRKLR